MKIRIMFCIYFITFFLLTSNTAYTQRLLKKSPYYTDPSKKALIMPNDLKVKKYTGDTVLKEIDPKLKVYFEEEIAKAKNLVTEGKNIEAIDLCYEIESKFSNNYLIYYTRAQAHENMGDVVYAKADYDKALSYFPNDKSFYSKTADFYSLIGKYEEALKIYITAYKVLEDNMWLFLAGNLALKNDDIPSANYYYMSLIKSKQKAYFYEGMGNIEFRTAEYDTAIEAFEFAIKEYKDEDEYESSLIATDKNIPRVNKFIEESNIEKSIIRWRERFLVKDFKAALSILNELTKYTSKHPELILYAGKTYFEMENYSEAKNILPYAIEAAPELEESYIILAQIYVFEKNYKKAVNILESGFEYAYDNPDIYETLIKLLFSIDSFYYPNKIIEQVINFYNLSPQNQIKYANYLISKKQYEDAENILLKISPPLYDANLALRKIEYNRVLDKAGELYEQKYYVDIMKLLSNYKFTGEDEEIRIRYLANAYQMLGSLDKAIEVLKEKFDSRDIGLNNLIFLRRLLEIRRGRDDISQKKKDEDLITIKSTIFLEEELNLNVDAVQNRVTEFTRYNQFQDAIRYLEKVKKTSLDRQAVRDLESNIYTYYAIYLKDGGDLTLAQNVVKLALARNANNFDAIAIKRDIEIQMFLRSLGDYTDDPAYAVITPTIKRIINLQPAYFRYRVLLASYLVKEYDLSGFDIGMKLRNISRIPDRYYSILGKIYFEAGLYEYANESYEKAVKYSDNKDIIIEYAVVQYHASIKQYSGAIKTLNNLLKKYPNDADIYYHISKVYSSEGKSLSKATTMIETALKMNPEQPYYLYQNAYINELTGNTDKALKGYISISKLYRNYTIAHYKSAFLLANIYNNPDAAEPYALLYLSFTPKAYQGDILLAIIYEKQAGEVANKSKISAAIDRYKRAYKNAIWGKDRLTRIGITETLNALTLKLN